MKTPITILACSIGLIAGCSGQPQNQAAPAQNATSSAVPAAPAPAAPAPTAGGEERGRRFAECSAVLDAMGRLYDAIATQRAGAEGENMRARATQRRTAAGLFEQEAVASGLAPEAVRGIKTETAARLEREQAGQDFGDFMLGVGRETDRCAALVRPAG